MSQEKPVESLLKKIQTKIRYGLTLDSISSVIQKIGVEFIPFYLFLEGINVPEITGLKRITSEYSFELLGPEDIKIIGTLDAGYSEERFLALLDAGEKCIGLKHNGEIAAFMWINFKELSYKSTIIHLKSNEAYLWYMYTVKSYRGKNLAPCLRFKSYEILKEMDRDVLYSVSNYFNSPAIKFKQKLNAKKLKIILFIKLFNIYSSSFTIRSY
jgi:hypothetical protein